MQQKAVTADVEGDIFGAAKLATTSGAEQTCKLQLVR